MMRVEVDLTKCIGSGQCVARVAAVFDQGEEDGLAVVLQSNPPAELHDLVRDAARNCPSRAITVSDD
jgi:ferredoxin